MCFNRNVCINIHGFDTNPFQFKPQSIEPNGIIITHLYRADPAKLSVKGRAQSPSGKSDIDLTTPDSSDLWPLKLQV